MIEATGPESIGVAETGHLGTGPFGPGYAQVYDLVYAEKNYDAECDLIEGFLTRHGEGAVERVLDIGCGTGNHAVRMAQRGFSVCGVDPAASMLEVATGKARSLEVAVDFECRRLQDIGSDDWSPRATERGLFDAVLLMSTILGYVATNEDIIQGLSGVRRLVRSGAVLIADLWFGPAVLAQGPRTRFRAISSDEKRVLRVAEGAIDLGKQIYRTDLRVLQLDGSRIEAETRECHDIRFFFPQELELLLASCGFALVGLHGFPDISIVPDLTTWPVILVAKAV